MRYIRRLPGDAMRPFAARLAIQISSGALLALLTNSAQLNAQQGTLSFSTIDFPGAMRTNPQGINNAGRIVGGYRDSAFINHGFVFSQGNFSTIDFPGSLGTTLTGINNLDLMVGYYTDNSRTLHGFLFSAGTFSTVDFPGAVRTQLAGINDAGTIVGNYTSANDPSGFLHGFILPNGTNCNAVTQNCVELGHPAGITITAQGINNSGQIVGGYANVNGGPAQPFLLSGGSFLTITPPAGSVAAEAKGVNNLGQILGDYSAPSTHFGLNGFLIFNGTSCASPPSASCIAFEFAELTATTPTGINDVGQIVGSYGGANDDGFLAVPASASCQLPTGEQFQVPPTGSTGVASLVLGMLRSGWDTNLAPHGTGYAFVEQLIGGNFTRIPGCPNAECLMEENAPSPPSSDNCPVPGILGVGLNSVPSTFTIDSNNMFYDEIVYPISKIYDNQSRLSPGQHCSNVAYQQMMIFCPAKNNYVPYGTVNQLEVIIYNDGNGKGHVSFSRAGVGASKKCNQLTGCLP